MYIHSSASASRALGSFMQMDRWAEEYEGINLRIAIRFKLAFLD